MNTDNNSHQNSAQVGSPQQAYNLMYVLDLLWKYRWYIITVVSVSVVLAFILSLPVFYHPEFKSSTIIYPANPERFDFTNLFADDPSIFVYGSSKEVEKLENIAGGHELRMRVIDSLNLWQAYDINPQNGKSPQFYALRTFDSKVQVRQVSGNGLEIEAYDENPQKAADIVNLMVYLIDEKNKEMLLKNKARILDMYRNNATILQKQLSVISDSTLLIRRKYNVFDVERQTEALLKQVLDTETRLAGEKVRLASLRKRYASQDTTVLNTLIKIDVLKKQLDLLVNDRSGSNINLEKFQHGLDELRLLEQSYLRKLTALDQAQDRISVLEMMSEATFNTIFVIEEAFPSDRKSRPVRWIILVATFMLSLLGSIIGIILIERILKFYQTPRYDQ